MRANTRLLPALSLLCCAFVARAPVAAQGDTSTLEITVQSATDDQPLGGAQVVVDGLGMGGITDPNGFLRIPGLPAGPRTVKVHFLGYASMDESISFRFGRPTRILVKLGVEPIALAPVNVRGGPSVLAQRGFYDRRDFGQGTFLTRDDIQKLNPFSMSDVLRRVGGINVGAPRFGRATARIRGATAMGNNCPIQYYVDGTFTAGFNIDDVPPDDIEGLEIYKGAATVPPVFNKGTALCGTIIIWTRID
ncbi:MAG: TonB-dependent receptor plug domain-containing protein [Gemmatimonadota bacterium]